MLKDPDLVATQGWDLDVPARQDIIHIESLDSGIERSGNFTMWAGGSIN